MTRRRLGYLLWAAAVALGVAGWSVWIHPSVGPFPYAAAHALCVRHAAAAAAWPCAAIAQQYGRGLAVAAAAAVILAAGVGRLLVAPPPR